MQFQQAQALHQRGQLAKARQIYEEILRVQPEHFGAMHFLGVIAAQSKQPERAVELMGRSIPLMSSTLPDSQKAIVFNNHGNALVAMNRNEEALDSYGKAIALDGNYAEAHYNRGIALANLEQYQAALASYDEALRQGRNAETYYNRGIALAHLDHYEEALDSYGKAIALDGNYAEAYYNRGNLFIERNQSEAAISSYDRAVAIRPEHALARLNRALALLLEGRFEEGWVEFEWRWRDENSPLFEEKKRFVQPLWLGDRHIAGKTLLLHSEQGLGDTIQFCRYAPLVRNLGATIVLAVQKPLKSALSGLRGVTHLVSDGDALPAFDYHCPMMSLPCALKTRLSTIPADIPYLQSNPEKSLDWREKLGRKTKPRVGLVWSGGFRPNQPELWSVNTRRNIPLMKLAPLEHPQIEFYSLQKGQAAESELADLVSKQWNGPRLTDYTHLLNDFSDTAALIEQLDLVISVDTSTAHLAGALGKPVWILNRFDTCWRWLLNRTDSPWYPSARLYRQEAPGDWDGVILRVKRDLLQLLA
jgi:Flp pilus assembly protein TadD